MHTPNISPRTMDPQPPSLDTSTTTSTTTSAPPSQVPITIPFTIPLGFAAQLRVLHQIQLDHSLRILALESENVSLKTLTGTLNSRIEALEAYNTHLAVRRRELVSQLNNLRTLNQEADNAFQMRSADIEAGDLEGMLAMNSAMMAMAVNHHQRALAQLRAGMQGGVPVRYAYPPGYSEQGYCFQHNMPYYCQFCGK